MTTGSITLNGIDDAILALAVKFKSEHEGKFGFNPQQMAPGQIPQGQHKPAKPGYNGMTFNWNDPAGLKLVIELLQKIEHHHSEQKAA